jgi:PAS domain S-box-containing protein
MLERSLIQSSWNKWLKGIEHICGIKCQPCDIIIKKGQQPTLDQSNRIQNVKQFPHLLYQTNRYCTVTKEPQNVHQAKSPRQQAEDITGEKPMDLESLSNDEIKTLVIKLTNQKLELKLQNEKLRQKKRELEDGRDTLQALIDANRHNQLMIDTDGRVLAANATVAQKLGLERMVGRNTFGFFTPQVATRRKVMLKEVVESRKAMRVEDEREGLRIRHDLTPVLDSGGNVAQVAVHSHDITRQVETERALKDSEERYRALSDATFETVFITEDGYCIETNEMATEMMGYAYDELIGMFGTDLMAPESRELVRHHMLSGYEQPYEALAQRKDGTTFYVEIHGKMVEYKGKKVRVSVIRDIDKFKRAEAALQDSKETMQALIDASTEREVLLDKKGFILALNETATHWIDAPDKNVIGCNLFDFFPDDIAKKRKAYFEEVIESRGPVHFKDRCADRFLSHTLFPVFDSKGSVAKIASFSLDLTRQQQTERALAESEEKYRQLFENGLDTIIVFDAETRRFESVNPASLELFGYTYEEFMKLNVEDMSAERQKTRQRIRKTILQESSTVRVPLRYYRKKDGTTFPGELLAAKFHSGGRLKIIGSIRDITERQKQTEMLRKRENELSGRVKELNCLYGISKLNEQPDLTLDAIFQGTVDLVAGALQFPEIAVARIRFENQDYKTANFIETPWRLIHEIATDRQPKGTLEIGYLEERPETDRGPFFEDEFRLLKAVSEGVGKIIQRKRTQWQLKRSKEKLRFLASRLLAAQERERKRISMELHDDLGQRLTVLKLQIRSIVDRLGSDREKLASECEKVLQHVTETIEQVRRISHDLSPSIIHDLGLSAALGYLFEDFAAHSGVKIFGRIPNIDAHFSQETAVIIYRIFQETITNVDRHSKAEKVSIDIQTREYNVLFVLEDNGSGFCMDKVAASVGPGQKGLGLAAMDERIRMIDGQLEISSRENNGTRIAFTVPIANRNEPT